MMKINYFDLFHQVKKELGLTHNVSISVTKKQDTSSNLQVYKNQYLVNINLNQCRTIRDFVFIAAHELAHLKQYLNNKNILKEVDTSNPKNYRLSGREWEADNEAINVTREMKYVNQVINKNTPSLFIEVMTLRN